VGRHGSTRAIAPAEKERTRVQTGGTVREAIGEAPGYPLPADAVDADPFADCEERWESVHGAFALKDGRQVDNCRILLLDDVMMTGATLDACSRALA